MPASETGKQRSRRIALDYFKRPGFLERGKLWLCAAALVLSLLWVAPSFLHDGKAREIYSPGPVASVHAAWETQCTACHVPFSPLSADVWTVGAFRYGQANSEKCTACHTGPVHHANQRLHANGDSADIACSACHHEHGGRDDSLVRMPDTDCTQCHRNLAEHMAGPSPMGDKYHNAITRFDLDHPPFRSVVPVDPGKLKFNHSRHMTAGMRLAPDGEPFTLQQIAASDRDRYRSRQKDQGDAAPVQLDCATCHQLEGNDFHVPEGRKHEIPGGLPSRRSGAYMVPITYENQCKACHPLTLSLPDSAPLQVPHRLQPIEVSDFLWGELVRRNLRDAPPPPLTTPLPGRDLSPEEHNRRQSVRDRLAALQVDRFLYKDQLSSWEKLMFLGNQSCGECHHFEGKDKDGVVPTRIVPTAVPEVWLKHAKFDHSAHRAVSCRECHDGAYPDAKNPSVKSTDVLIPGLANCVQCHALRTTVDGQVFGGARYDCTECHRYHHGDDPLAGIGASKRAPVEDSKRGVSGFMHPR